MEPFKKYPDGTFGYVGPQTSVPTASAHHEGDELWVQWYQRIDTGMLKPFDGYLHRGYQGVTAGAGATKLSDAACGIPSTAVGHTVWIRFGSNLTPNTLFTGGCRRRL